MGSRLQTKAARPFHGYWFNVKMLLREEVILPWAFPPTLEQGEKFKSDIIAKVDQMLKWL
jgi:hypothetical protein